MVYPGLRISGFNVHRFHGQDPHRTHFEIAAKLGYHPGFQRMTGGISARVQCGHAWGKSKS